MKPQKVFYLIAFSFGLFLLVITPPFQPQDENCHFYRAYQVSAGTLSPIREGQRLGGYFPESLQLFYDRFHPYVLTGHNKVSPGELWDARLIPLDPRDEIFIDFTNTSLYPALLYIPQAAGIFIGRLAGAGPFWLLYLGRLFNLLFFIGVTGQAIRIIPLKKWLFVILTTLPMSYIVHSSLSADLFVNALSYFVVAYILHLVFTDKIRNLNWREIGILLVCSVMLGVAKLVYVPILLLLFLIPVQRFRSRFAQYGILIFLFLSGLGASIIQKEIIDNRYIPYSKYNEKYRDYTALKSGVDINRQLEFIKEHPISTARVFIRSYAREFRGMTQGYIGLIGWEHTFPPGWFVIICYLFILLYTLIRYPGGTSHDLTTWHRLIFGLIVVAVSGMIMLSQYLSWDRVGEDSAYPLIGRYFIPVFPLFFLMVSDLIGRKKLPIKKALAGPGVMLFAIFTGILTLWLVLRGSYTTNSYSEKQWSVDYSFQHDFNGLKQTEYIKSGPDTLATFRHPRPNHVTDRKAFTGPFSLIINKDNPYGFEVRILRGFKGDKVVASCRTYGRGGYIDFQEWPDGVNTWIFKAYPLNDSLGWKYQEAGFILPDDIEEELRVFTWWPHADSIYVDCFRLEYFAKD